MASSEPSTSRLPEEDSSDMDSDSDDEFYKLPLPVKSRHLSGLHHCQSNLYIYQVFTIDSQISTSIRSSPLTVKSLHLSGLHH